LYNLIAYKRIVNRPTSPIIYFTQKNGYKLRTRFFSQFAFQIYYFQKKQKKKLFKFYCSRRDVLSK